MSCSDMPIVNFERSCQLDLMQEKYIAIPDCKGTKKFLKFIISLDITLHFDECLECYILPENLLNYALEKYKNNMIQMKNRIEEGKAIITKIKK